MPQQVYANVKALMQSVNAYLLDNNGAQGVSPETAYTVKNCPVAFVAKRSGTEYERVFLKRVDWKRLSRGRRILATLGSVFGIGMGRKTHLSVAQKQIHRAATLRMQQKAATHVSAQERILSRLLVPGGSLAASASGPLADGADGAQEPEHRTAAMAELRQKVIDEFSVRVRHILPALRDQCLHQPADVAQKACEIALRPLRADLNARMARCKAAGMTDAECFGIVRELGINQCIQRWIRVSREYSDPASRKKAMSLTRVHYHLNEIPTRQLHIDPTTDAVLGDLHGNCRLLLHSLVSLGFFTISNTDAWNAVCAQLASLETGAPNNDWPSFLDRIRNAIEPAAGAKDRRLTLIGDILAGPCGNDMFMAAILAHMDACQLDFECMFGNHDAEFLSYFLTNVGNERLLAPRATGVRMDEGQARSLYRLHALLTESAELRPAFEQRVESGFLKHLKVASFSRNGKTFYSHAFANGALLSQLLTQANIGRHKFFTEQVRALNDWFRTEILPNRQAFSLLYHDGSWPGATAPISPLRAIAWHIGMDLNEYGDQPAHANNAGVSLPDERLEYAVHGHCQDVGNHVGSLVKRTAELERLMPRLLPLTDTSSHFLTGVRPYLPMLNVSLASVNVHTGFDVLDVLAPFVARRLHELRANPDAQALVATLRNTEEPEASRANALCDFWNTHCRTGQAPLKLDFRRWGAPVQERMLRGVQEWLARPPEGWSAEAKDFLDAKRRGAAATRRAFTAAIRQNLPAGDETRRTDGRLTDAELNAYVGALKRSFLSIDDVAGSRPGDTAFSRLVHLVSPRAHRAPHHANA